MGRHAQKMVWVGVIWQRGMVTDPTCCPGPLGSNKDHGVIPVRVRVPAPACFREGKQK